MTPRLQIIIAQSIPDWIGLIRSAIETELPHLAEHVTYCDSFDQTLEVLHLDKPVLIVASNLFHDENSAHNAPSSGVPDEDKTAENLARIAKSMNSDVRVFVYSQYQPTESIFLDGYISKEGDERSIKLVIQAIKDAHK